jgi:hypothetical protein
MLALGTRAHVCRSVSMFKPCKLVRSLIRLMRWLTVWNVLSSDARGMPPVGLRPRSASGPAPALAPVPCSKPCALQPELQPNHVLYVTSATPMLGGAERGSLITTFPATQCYSDTSCTDLGIPSHSRPRQSAMRLQVPRHPIDVPDMPVGWLLCTMSNK